MSCIQDRFPLLSSAIFESGPLYSYGMFKPKDEYFSKVRCPELSRNRKCGILNCIFSHEAASKRPMESEPFRANKRVQAIPKKEEKTTVIEAHTKDVSFMFPKAVTHLEIPKSERIINARQIAKKLAEKGSKTPNREALALEYEDASKSSSLKEYQEKIGQFLHGVKTVLKDPKYVLPKEVTPNAPATIQTRKKHIQLLVDALKKVNPGLKTPILEATEAEFAVASEASSTTYPQLFRKKLYQISHPEKVKATQKELTSEQLHLKLAELVIPTEKLASFGYIMETPTATVPVQKRTCRRCNGEFALDDVMSPVRCRFHDGKVIRKDKNTRVYGCCGAPVGGDTEPCGVGENHVFYWSNPGEMQWFLPFQNTRDLYGTRNECFKAVGIDCEMGYTSSGFELLRVTVMDFFTGEEILDLLVRPIGQVIDLNTRWSGVSEIADSALSFDELMSLLGEIIDQNTILVGHGLENDVNALRLIHERIVDTAILYPKHQATPTFRHPLKSLAFRYLGRTIQTGQHDSNEDSLAAIDIVKHFIKEDLKRT